jgi:hypothetical protein
MGQHNLPGNRQTKTGSPPTTAMSGPIRLVETLEYPLLIFRSDANACI